MAHQPDDREPLPDSGPPPPYRRRPTDPAQRIWRTPTMSLRRVSGMSLWVRIDRQVERDALLHALAAVDRSLLALSHERRAIVDALAAIRDELYPVVPWCHGRRPPDLDHGPFPAAIEGAEAVEGRTLRATCLTILRRHGATSLRDLHALLHRYGYVVRAERPVTALSDAMAYEVEQGRAHRVERGVYDATGPEPPRRRDRPSPFPDLPDLPAAASSHRPCALDPALDQDPGWTDRHPAPVSHPPTRADPCGSRNDIPRPPKRSSAAGGCPAEPTHTGQLYTRPDSR